MVINGNTDVALLEAICQTLTYQSDFDYFLNTRPYGEI